MSILLTLIFIQQSYAQDVFSQPIPVPNDALEVLETKQFPPSVNRQIKIQLQGISTDWTSIYGIVEGQNIEDQAFGRTMAYNEQLLMQASGAGEYDEVIDVIQAVSADLQTKNKYISYVREAGYSTAKMFEVAVEVRTKNAENLDEVNGYYVSFSPLAYTDSKPMFRFNIPTSPSTGHLPPGNYIMNVEIDGEIVQKQSVSIGASLGLLDSITCIVKQ
ncbi:hypothetical protein K1W69_18405 [Hoeflea sp. WL0058]|uniref:Uncharacterized protein n=1 Tax=Flavimaribacter sediminis TaxID=2865987 RepID=A0AAE3D1R7_9HYPH|nr:hypothetical protein [Flavimaribacter sediminis]MBW8639174.1 hypothetical protein [Flavimaribacter sediminis]